MVLELCTSAHCKKHAHQVWCHLNLRQESYVPDKQTGDTASTAAAKSNPYMSPFQVTQKGTQEVQEDLYPSTGMYTCDL